MDPKERIDSLIVAVQQAVEGALPSIWTSMPGILQSFNADAMTCEVQPAIMMQVTGKDGKKTWTQLPLLVDVPVQFIGGNDFFLTIPPKSGDEGLVSFSCRCIDAWWQNGGIQQQAEMRMHDLSDGFFIPGFRSQKNKITNFNSDYPELRNKDGSISFAMTAIGWKVKGMLEISGDLRLGGSLLSVEGQTYGSDLKTSGNVIGGQGTADQIGLLTHKHPANNQPPTPGT